MREFCIAVMLNASLKSCFMQEFGRFSIILAGLVGYKISPRENKNVQKNKKRVFIKIIKKSKKPFYIYVCIHHCYLLPCIVPLHTPSITFLFPRGSAITSYSCVSIYT